ncbi:MAG: transposase [Alphaproteobacteria bacterium]
MRCPHCHSNATSERSARTAHGYRRFGCRECRRGFNERTGSLLNRLLLPTDVVYLIVPWRLGLKLSLRDLAEVLLLRGLVFSHDDSLFSRNGASGTPGTVQHGIPCRLTP